MGCNGNSGSGAYVPKAPKEIPPASLAAGEESKIFPIQIGNRWRYNMERMAQLGTNRIPQNDDFFLEVKNVQDIPEGKRITLEQIKNDVTVDRQTWEIRKDGIYEVSLGLDNPTTNTPPVPQIPFPIEKDKKFSYTGQALTPFGKVGKVTIEGTIIGPEEVDTNMGRLSAIRVDSKKTFEVDAKRKGTEETSTWYAPNVGIVRMVQTTMASTNAAAVLKLQLAQATLK